MSMKLMHSSFLNKLLPEKGSLARKVLDFFCKPYVSKAERAAGEEGTLICGPKFKPDVDEEPTAVYADRGAGSGGVPFSGSVDKTKVRTAGGFGDAGGQRIHRTGDVEAGERTRVWTAGETAMARTRLACERSGSVHIGDDAVSTKVYLARTAGRTSMKVPTACPYCGADVLPGEDRCFRCGKSAVLRVGD